MNQYAEVGKKKNKQTRRQPNAPPACSEIAPALSRGIRRTKTKNSRQVANRSSSSRAFPSTKDTVLTFACALALRSGLLSLQLFPSFLFSKKFARKRRNIVKVKVLWKHLLPNISSFPRKNQNLLLNIFKNISVTNVLARASGEALSRKYFT